MPPGQPTKYKPEYCQLLIDHMTEGLSFESFAGKVGTCRQTVYNWLENEAFLDAKNKGSASCQEFWEKQGLKGLWMEDGDRRINNGIWIFNMKNRFAWKDRVEHSGDENKPIILEGYDPKRRTTEQ